MTGFNDREEGFENKFAHDAAFRFKVEARRNKMLGEWVAELLGLPQGEIDAYAKTVILSDMEEPGEEDVFRKVSSDLAQASKNVSESTIREKMASLLIEAKKSMMTEG